MIAWRAARIFLLHLLAMAVLVVMLAGASAAVLPGQVKGQGQRERAVQSAASVLQPRANPVLRVPKDAPSVFE